MDLKKLLASSSRQKILKALSNSKQVNVMGLVQRINSTYNETNRNLKIFEKEDIITNYRCGRQRLIMLNRENPRTRILLQALIILETENTTATPY